MSNQVIEGFRLSPQQEHLWRLEQSAHESPYRAQCAVRIEGRLDIAQLKAAIEDVVRRHEILRTTFTRPVSMMTSLQTVGEVAGFSFDHGDLSGLEDEEIERLYEEFGLEPFDLEAGPLLRVSLQRLAAEDHLLLLALPTLCADRAALDNLVREIGRAYAARMSSVARDQEEVTPYIVFAEWQNELLASEDAEVGREFWRAQRLSELPSLTLPVERRAEDQTEFAPRIVRALLPRQTFDHVARLAEQQSTTSSAVLLACWQTLLGRLSGEQVFVLGLGCDGRSDEELAGALGPFAKYLPLRAYVDEGASFVQLLSATDSAARAAEEWQECFTWELIAPRTTLAEDRYFPFCFDFYEAPEPIDAGDVTLAVTRSYACTDRFHLLLSCVAENEDLWTEFHYDAGAFDANEVQRIAGQYHALVQSA